MIIHFVVFYFFYFYFLVEPFLIVPWLQKLVCFTRLCSMLTSRKNQGLYLVSQAPPCTHEEWCSHGIDKFFWLQKKNDGGRERNVLKWRGDEQTLGKPEASSMYLQTHNSFIKTLQGLHAVSLKPKVLKWTPGCRMPGSAPFTLWHFLPYSLHPGHSALSCSSCAKHTNPGPL